MKKSQIFMNGVIKENPVLMLMLGTCPALAVTTSAINGLGMGIATLAVLLGSNIVISLLKNIIPKAVRIPCYIVVISGFVTIVGFLVKAYAQELDAALGVFLPLIVVNCIILGRAEMFASKNGVLDSAVDALGMGAGFTLALFAMGSIRELLGAGSILSFAILPETFPKLLIMTQPPGGFFVYGVLLAAIQAMPARKGKPLEKKHCGACAGCPAAAQCAAAKDE